MPLKQITSSTVHPGSRLKEAEWRFALTGGKLGRLFHKFKGRTHIWTVDRPLPKRLAYGHMFTNTQDTISISNNNPTEVASGLTTGITQSMTFSGSHNLTLKRGGIYEIVWSLSISQATTGVKLEIEGGIMINGAAKNEGQAHRTIDGVTDTGAMCSEALLKLAGGDEVSLFIQNETNTTNINIEHMNVSLTEKGRRPYGQER